MTVINVLYYIGDTYIEVMYALTIITHAHIISF